MKTDYSRISTVTRYFSSSGRPFEPGARQEAPVIEKEIWQRFKNKGLKLFGVGVKENSDQSLSWSKQHQLTYPVITDPDGEIYKRFGTGSVPYHITIDKSFIIRLSEETFDRDHVIQLLNAYFQNEA